MYLIRSVAVTFLALTVVACKSSHIVEPVSTEQRVDKRAPEWVVSPPREDLFLYGVGSSEIYGDSVRALQKADDVARGDLIKQLKVSVSQSLTASTSTENNQVFRKTEIIVNSKVPETEMVGIERADTFVDQTHQVAYALVRLDRRKAISTVKSELYQQELRLTKYDQYPLTGNVMADVRELIPALTDIRKYELNAEKLKLLAANNKEHLANLYDAAALKKKIYGLLSQIQIRLEPMNREAHKLETMMERQLTKLDVSLVNSADAELVLKYSLEVIEKEQKQTQFVLMTADIKVIDSNGRVVSAGVISGKGGAYDRDVAHKRALAKISDKIETEVVKGLLSSI